MLLGIWLIWWLVTFCLRSAEISKFDDGGFWVIEVDFEWCFGVWFCVR